MNNSNDANEINCARNSRESENLELSLKGKQQSGSDELSTSCDNRFNLDQAHLDFISTVSHELRTPLTSIRGFADTLITSFDRLSPEQREKFLLIIKDQSNRLIKLVENLLMVSKIQSEKEVLVYKSVNPSPFVESCVQLLKSQYKTHKFVFDIEKNLPDILVDTDKFQQIIINLLDNAAKYSAENSEIKVSIKQKTSSNSLHIGVLDNGIGISEKDIDLIFHKFARIDSPLTRKIQGSGLGLYITKNLVEKMNGKISVSSGKEGSLFEVEFPVAKIDDSCLKKIKEQN